MNNSSRTSRRETKLSASRANSILVAEDDATNRDVIRRQLERLGYDCDIASDGVQALKLWHAGQYDLLMTDLHMPGMDGFELTAAVRGEEGARDRRTTIIAFTASSVHGEIQKCLDAGMDSYLTKPLGMKELREALDQWLEDGAGVAGNESEGPLAHPSDRTPPSYAADKATMNSEEGAVIDERSLKSMFGDDPETFREILNQFLDSARGNIAQIRTGVEGRSANAVQAASHKLKSSARSVGANRLVETAVLLEAAGKSGDWKVIDDEFPGLSGIMEEIELFVKAL